MHLPIQGQKFLLLNEWHFHIRDQAQCFHKQVTKINPGKNAMVYLSKNIRPLCFYHGRALSWSSHCIICTGRPAVGFCSQQSRSCRLTNTLGMIHIYDLVSAKHRKDIQVEHYRNQELTWAHFSPHRSSVRKLLVRALKGSGKGTKILMA